MAEFENSIENSCQKQLKKKETTVFRPWTNDSDRYRPPEAGPGQSTEHGAAQGSE